MLYVEITAVLTPRKSLSSLLLLALVLVSACSKDYPTNTERVKYLNRSAAGSRIDFGTEVFVPKKINILYFYADW